MACARIMLLNRVVRQVDRFVEIVQVEFARTEAQIAVAIHPYLQMVAGERDEEVLTNVKFRIVDQKWFLCKKVQISSINIMKLLQFYLNEHYCP